MPVLQRTHFILETFLNQCLNKTVLPSMDLAISYIRFSSKKQVQSDSLRRQLENTRTYAKTHNLLLDESITYQDLGVSAWQGANRTRGMLKTLLDNLKAGKIRARVLLIERLDRLTREGMTTGINLMMDILRTGIEVHSTVSGRIFKFPKDATAEFMLAMEVGIEFFQAAYENEKRSERVGAKWAAKRADAVATGKAMTAKVPHWLEAVNGGPIVALPDRVAIVKKIFNLAELGYGAKRIIAKLTAEGDAPFARADKGKRWTIPYIQAMLNSRAVLGEYTPYIYTKGEAVAAEPIPNYFPAIITERQFEAVRGVINAKNRVPAEKRGKRGGNLGGGRNCGTHNLFSYLIFNAASGKAMNFHRKKTNTNQYLVSAYEPGVKASRMRYDVFERGFLSFLQDLDWRALSCESDSKELTQINEQLDKALSDLSKLNRVIVRDTALLDDPDTDLPTVKFLHKGLAEKETRRQELQQAKAKLEQQISTLRAQSGQIQDAETLLEALKGFKPVFQDDKISISARQKDTEVLRQRLQNEIRRRISRIDLIFGATILGSGAGIAAGTGRTVAKVHFVNGAERMLVFQGETAVALWFA